EALAAYRDVLRGWVDLGLLLDEALTGMDMAAGLDPAEPEVRSAINRSRAILEHLRAAPVLARLDRILGSRSATTRPASERESSPVS
ncbi:MAG TPA: hypothetical protein VFK54_07740, partial [Candidatus Limnocylindrales bacterium]|nr:hypothetical protein [Candidatus Limnocylindrales bacterium]